MENNNRIGDANIDSDTEGPLFKVHEQIIDFDDCHFFFGEVQRKVMLLALEYL